MKAALAAAFVGLLLPSASAAGQVPPSFAATPALASAEVIAVIQVHGNNATPEADVLSLVGVAIGDSFTPTTLAEVRDRLLRSGRFEDVEVRKRFASIADLSRVALVIIVDEFAVRVELPVVPGGPPRLVRRSLLGGAMFMPILRGEDGYGLTYGGRIAYVGVAGDRSRLSFPLTWGGQKQAAVEFERVLRRGPISRVSLGGSIERRTNPAFDEDDDRRHVWGRIERNVSDVQVGTTVGWQEVSFAEEGDRFTSFGVDATFDTRVDPALPRNALYARASWTHLVGQETGAIDRTALDVRGYVALVGQAVLVARAEQDTASRSLPRYFKPLLGGWSNLRGFPAGSFAGDTRVTGTLEVRLPVSSPLSVAKTGVSVFVDAGKAYDKGVRFDDVRLETGVGIGAWLSATIVQAGVAVAHGRGGDTRVNVSLGLTF
jgi:outer membrane protein assembly factor BamA